MMVAAFHMAGKMTKKLQESLIKCMENSLEDLSIQKIKKLFATMSRHGALEDNNLQPSPMFNEFKAKVV